MGYFIGIVFILGGIREYSQRGAIHTAVMWIVAILALPPTVDLLRRATGTALSWKLRLAIAIGLLVADALPMTIDVVRSIWASSQEMSRRSSAPKPTEPAADEPHDKK